MTDKQKSVERWLAFVREYCRKYPAAERIQRYDAWAEQLLKESRAEGLAEDENLELVRVYAKDALKALEDGDIDLMLQAFERMVRYSMRVQSGGPEE